MLIEPYLDQLRKTSILIATPMYGGLCTGSFSNALASLFQLAGRYELPIQFQHLTNESLITRARNRLAHIFLSNPKFTHLLFIDADIGFSIADVLSLAIQAGPESDRAVVCGAYPKKSIQWNQVRSAIAAGVQDEDQLVALSSSFPFETDSERAQDFNMSEPQEIKYGATGFMMIRRDVFEQLAPTLTDRTYNDPILEREGFDPKVTSYFDCDIDQKTQTYLSEDYAFCQRVRAQQIKIWLCPWIKLTHTGNFTFSGGISDFAKAGLPINPPDE